jgi:hypothetical protein
VTDYRNINSPRQKTPALSAPAGPAPGWKTKTHRRYISKDRELLKELEHACSKGNDKTRKVIAPFPSTHFQLIPIRNGGFSKFQASFPFTFNTAYHTSSEIPQYPYTLSYGSKACTESFQAASNSAYTIHSLKPSASIKTIQSYTLFCFIKDSWEYIAIQIHQEED